MRFTLAPHLFDVMLEHVKAAHPNEGCGLIAGRSGVGERFIPMRNTAANPATRFAMDPSELVRAFQSMRGAGEEIAAICHSHPFGPAAPSSVDIEEAQYPHAFQIIISLENVDRPVFRAFRILEGRVTEVELAAIV
jgi:proteasome lid subunit RPN8/RPN11